ncbi:MAG: O-antigen ligase family protein [Alphaproteobacteria bacterium]
MQQKTLFMRIGIALSALQMGAFIFSTPPFQGGVWHIAEPLMLAHFSIAALIFAWLAYGAMRGLLAPLPRNPFTITFALWLIVQLVTVILSDSPWRAWFSSPGSGEGTAWWMALSAGVALTAQLWRIASYQRALLCVAGFVTIILSSLHFLLHDKMLRLDEPLNPWEPNNWPDYLAFCAAYLWLAYSVSVKNTHAMWRLCILAICLFALLHSHNFIGIVLICSALVISVLAQTSAAFKRIFAPARAWIVLATIAFVLPVSWWVYSFSYQYDDVGLAAEESLFAARNEGLGSRVLLNKVALSTLQHEPSRLVTGNGFGHFTDDLFQHGLVDGTTVFRDGARNPNWFLLDGTGYHSHSQPMEALLSFGILGFMLFLALPITLLWILPKHLFWPCAPMIVALAVLSNFWFEIPHVLGIHALAFGALICVCSPEAAPRKQKSAGALCTIAALAMLASSLLQWNAITYGNRLFAAARSTDCSTITPEFLSEDIPRGAERFNEVAISYVIDLAARIRQQNIRDSDANCVQKFFDTAKAVAQNSATADYAALLWLQLHYELFISLQHPTFDAIRAEAKESFADAAIHLAARAPSRDDKAAIFLMSLGEYTKNDINKQIDILHKILTAVPNHRSAQWLMGYLLAQHPDTQAEGNAMRDDAIKRGVQSVFPIAKE